MARLPDADEPPTDELPTDEPEPGRRTPRKKDPYNEDERDLRGLPTIGSSANTETEKTPMAARITYFIATLCITFALIFKVLYELNHP